MFAIWTQTDNKIRIAYNISINAYVFRFDCDKDFLAPLAVPAIYAEDYEVN